MGKKGDQTYNIDDQLQARTGYACQNMNTCCAGKLTGGDAESLPQRTFSYNLASYYT
jgi:hypothetical protein